MIAFIVKGLNYYFGNICLVCSGNKSPWQHSRAYCSWKHYTLSKNRSFCATI